MTIVVLLFLAGIWGVVLYGYLRDRLAETRPADSIGSFRRQLSVLERTGPVAPGYRSTESRSFPTPSRPAMAMRRPLPGAARPGMAATRHRGPSLAQRRRRDILLGLLAAMGGSLLLGFVPALRVMWGLHVALDVLFVAYVALLVRFRNLAAEREMKLRFLPASQAGKGEPALLLRRTVN